MMRGCCPGCSPLVAAAGVAADSKQEAVTGAPMMNVLSACRVVLHARAYRHLALGLFLLALGLYLFTLPATFTGGVIGLVSLRYLNAELIFFSVTLALLLSLIVTFNLYGFRSSLRRQGAGLSVGAVLASLVPSSVCCTSLVPSLLAAVGASTPQIFGLTGRIQGTVARYEALFLAAALILLLVSLGSRADRGGGVPWQARETEVCQKPKEDPER